MKTANRVDTPLDRDPAWYKKGVIYQAHVRSFYDSDANGIGDFRGLTQKLDYLQDLGVTALWLLPFYPSPLRDEGYDIADYRSINPIYGRLGDFKSLLREAHRRGLRVITELVINHTSDQHPWFQRSRRARPGSRWRQYYVWSDSAERYRDARIVFKDFETSNWTWDPVAKAYYWHRFYSHQPDLNFDNPQVHEEILGILDFWLELGVDGLRLDAVPYLYEREGTNCENLPETHEFLKLARRHVEERYEDRMLLAEANQWPEDAVAYFGTGRGDECHMAFHFPLMPRLFMAVRMEDRVPIVDILDQTPPIPETSQWAIFLRNHDELTLEMVTDEERDYMYRVYARDTRARLNLGIRRRLAPLLGNDRKRLELLNALLFSLPGTPVIYYGDEIGMGDNIFLGDRNGVRTPMQWSSDRNAGFSRANPQSLYLPINLDPEYHYEAVNVDTQIRNPHSLLWWMKRLIALRKRLRAFGLGSLKLLSPENRKILAFVREHESERLLVVANLSRFVQPVELDLSEYRQMVPVEVFGRTEFPPVVDRPYSVTLSPHAFYWFNLKPRFPETVVLTPGGPAAPALAALSAPGRWEEILQDRARLELEAILPDYIRARRWFGSKARELKGVEIREAVPVPLHGGRAYACLVRVDYLQGDPELYLLPLAHATGAEAEALLRDYPHLVVARLHTQHRQQEGLLYDATGNRAFGVALLDAMSRRKSWKGTEGELNGYATSALRQIRAELTTPLEPTLGKAEQSNSALVFGDKFLLKLFRKLDVGINPDVEISRFLTRRDFPHVAPLLGYLEYRRTNETEETISLGILNGFVPGAKDGWEHTLDSLGRFYERVGSLPETARTAPTPALNLMSLAREELPAEQREVFGAYVDTARLLGDRTAALHRALAEDLDDPDFAPEPFTPFYVRGLYQSMRNLAKHNLQMLRRRLKELPDAAKPDAERVLAAEEAILRRFRSLVEKRVQAKRVRAHGDYHLGQVLHTGKDFVIIDFEGEPARSLGERRLKRCPLRDVAGMIRSFHYVAYAALHRQAENGTLGVPEQQRFEPWTRCWYRWVGAAYLRAYLAGIRPAALLPENADELGTLLGAYLLEKAMYELGYELNNRPDWVRIPLQGILQLIES